MIGGREPIFPDFANESLIKPIEPVERPSSPRNEDQPQPSFDDMLNQKNDTESVESQGDTQAQIIGQPDTTLHGPDFFLREGSKYPSKEELNQHQTGQIFDRKG